MLTARLYLVQQSQLQYPDDPDVQDARDHLLFCHRRHILCLHYDIRDMTLYNGTFYTFTANITRPSMNIASITLSQTCTQAVFVSQNYL